MKQDEQYTPEEVESILREYIRLVKAELYARWKAWGLQVENLEVHEAVGGLLARQVTLAIELAQNPGIWNGNIAPLSLRAMTDIHINIAWILKDPLPRSQEFIKYGLGQEKLFLEHQKQSLKEKGKDPDKIEVIQHMEQWLDSQRFTFLTEVNVGSWSERDVRTMADEADCLDLYRFAYQPFSGVVHSTWQHIAKYNLELCENPLHHQHRIPVVRDSIDPDVDYLYRAAKYVRKSFHLFDETFGIKVDAPLAFDYLCSKIFPPKPTPKKKK